MKLRLAVLPAAAAGAVLAGCGGGAPAARHSTTIGIADNQIVLTAKESRRLVQWFGNVRNCLAARRVPVGELVVTRKQLTLPVGAALSLHQVLRTGVACAERFGGPPSNASLQTFRGRMILYLPKACLLDAKVAARPSSGR